MEKLTHGQRAEVLRLIAANFPNNGKTHDWYSKMMAGGVDCEEAACREGEREGLGSAAAKQRVKNQDEIMSLLEAQAPQTDADDLVHRLRTLGGPHSKAATACNEAADRIDALKSALANERTDNAGQRARAERAEARVFELEASCTNQVLDSYRIERDKAEARVARLENTLKDVASRSHAALAGDKTNG
jgi:hypothetical protein